MVLALNGQVPDKALLWVQQQLVGSGPSCAMRGAWTNQEDQLWPCRGWKEGNQGDLQQLTVHDV